MLAEALCAPDGWLGCQSWRYSLYGQIRGSREPIWLTWRIPTSSARFFHPSRLLERDDKKWEPVFVSKSRDNKNLGQTFDSIKYHPDLGRPVYVDLG